MKLLLVNPFSPFLINPTAFPPLALLYVAAAAELDGCEVKVCDLASTDKFFGYSPDMIGVTACTPHIPILKELIEALWELYPGVPIILGGPHFSQRPKDGERFRADAVCIGDGEPVIRKFLAGGRGIITHSVEKIRVLPARHLLDLKRYHYEIAGLPATTMLTARGCPYSCAYCSRGPGYDTLRYNPLDLVASEVDEIVKLGFKAIMLYDDELNISTRRLKGLCEVLKHAGVKWRGFIRSNLFTHEQARVMGDSGCVEVYLVEGVLRGVAVPHLSFCCSLSRYILQ